MSISLFQPREMGRALRQMTPPKTFLRDLFFSARIAMATETVDIDVQRGSRRLAPFVNKNLPAPVINRHGFTSYPYTPPTVSEKRITIAEDLLTRQPGESIYDAVTPEQRAAEILGTDLADLDEMIARREEWMVAKALFDAEISVVGDGVDDVIEFPRADTHTIAIGDITAWTDKSNATIWKNLRDWRRVITKSGAKAPTDAILGAAAADALIANTALKQDLDTRRMDLGMLNPQLVEAQGVTYLGMLAGTGLDLWTYDEWYYDTDEEAEVAMVPEKYVLLGSRHARTELRYGAVSVINEATKQVQLVRGERVPDSWIQHEPPARFLKVSSRPLPIPIEIDSFLVAQVVA